METRALNVLYFCIQNTSYNGGDTMTIYKIKVTTGGTEVTINVPEKDMQLFLDKAKELNWKIEFIE